MTKPGPFTDNGLIYMGDMRRQNAANMMDAVALGLGDTWDSMRQVFQNLRGMILSAPSHRII